MVLVYEKENCTQCYGTKLFLNKLGVVFETRHVVTDETWKDYLPDAKSAPVVVNLTTGEAWSGYRRDRLIECAS